MTSPKPYIFPNTITTLATRPTLTAMTRLVKLRFRYIFLAAILLIAVVAVVCGIGGMALLPTAISIHTPGELIRHAQRRLQGHNKLEAVLTGPLRLVQTKVERPVPPAPLPTLGKGQQPIALPPLQYLPNGQPIEAQSLRAPARSGAPASVTFVSTANDIVRAINAAVPGQTIEIAPGRYTINRRVDTRVAGNITQPITVRASQPGQVTIEFDTLEGFYVSQPFWVFENLHIRGICKQHGNCEHAFHIVGKANSTVVRNNTIEDFNAHFKVNGIGTAWPDDGLLQYNTITNHTPRYTSAPVTPVDIVAGSRWHLLDNLISNFVKTQGNQISFGLFLKGGGSGGRVERNLIVCTPQNLSQPGTRVGLSFGGGETGKAFCRDQQCDFEHTAGLAANNILAHCNDFGIDVNRSRNILIAHNTLINTAGIDVRGKSSAIKIYANLLEGRIRARDGSDMTSDMNEVVTMKTVYRQPDSLQLEWLTLPANIPSLAIVPKDICGRVRVDGTLPGALSNATGCFFKHAQP